MPRADNTSAHQNSRILYTGGNFTTTSTSFVDVDTTNARITITTGANPCLVGYIASVTNDTTGQGIFLDLEIDGVRQSGVANGLVSLEVSASNVPQLSSFVYQTTTLTAASHTFDLQWRVSGNTGTMIAGVSSFHFWVTELK